MDEPTRLHHDALERDTRTHPRDWQGSWYCYPVISRRSGGLSVGINLNPDGACNFKCVYCQVDRDHRPKTPGIDLARLEDELHRLVSAGADGSLFDTPEFAHTPRPMRVLRDIAFSGDGEPTASPYFSRSMAIAARVRSSIGLESVKLVLITNAAYLHRPAVRAALDVLDREGGEIWAKLDAGSPSHFERINRTRVPWNRIVTNIVGAARVRPVIIQSMMLCIDGRPPSPTDIDAYARCLIDIRRRGGCIGAVHLYTVARRPAEAGVTALPNAQLDAIGRLVHQRCQLPVQVFYGE